MLHRSIESFYNDRPLITTITKHFFSTYCDNHQPVLGHLLRQSSTTSWESSMSLPSLETDNITWHLICFLGRFCRASIFCSLDSCEPVNIVLVLCSFYMSAPYWYSSNVGLGFFSSQSTVLLIFTRCLINSISSYRLHWRCYI